MNADTRAAFTRLRDAIEETSKVALHEALGIEDFETRVTLLQHVMTLQHWAENAWQIANPEKAEERMRAKREEMERAYQVGSLRNTSPMVDYTR
jgi:hypothetical protein